MLKRPHYIAAALVVLLTLVTLTLPDKTTARMKLAIGSLFVPLFGLANSAQQAAARASDAVLPRSELLRQNELLRRQNQELRLEAAQADGIAQENERLRGLLAWPQQKRWKLKMANVVLREPSNWWRTVQIDLGSRDGIRVNMAVLTVDGLIGRVSSVSLIRSQVVLLGDPACKVAARVDNPARDTGVIGPAGSVESEFVEMSFLPGNANLKPGQAIITSGIGGIFPKDIPVGKIVDSHPVEYGLNLAARVKLNANLSSLEEVWVLLEP
jgi:rod shape-determining protein MreC